MYFIKDLETLYFFNDFNNSKLVFESIWNSTGYTRIAYSILALQWLMLGVTVEMVRPLKNSQNEGKVQGDQPLEQQLRWKLLPTEISSWILSRWISPCSNIPVKWDPAEWDQSLSEHWSKEEISPYIAGHLLWEDHHSDRRGQESGISYCIVATMPQPA